MSCTLNNALKDAPTANVESELLGIDLDALMLLVQDVFSSFVGLVICLLKDRNIIKRNLSVKKRNRSFCQLRLLMWWCRSIWVMLGFHGLTPSIASNALNAKKLILSRARPIIWLVWNVETYFVTFATRTLKMICISQEWTPAERSPTHGSIFDLISGKRPFTHYYLLSATSFYNNCSLWVMLFYKYKMTKQEEEVWIDSNLSGKRETAAATAAWFSRNNS